MSFAQLRRQYTLGGLHRNSMHEDPIEQFKLWMKEALDNCPGDWFVNILYHRPAPDQEPGPRQIDYEFKHGTVKNTN